MTDPLAENLREARFEHEIPEAQAGNTAYPLLHSRLAIDAALPFDPAQLEAGLSAWRDDGLAQPDGLANGRDDGAPSGAARMPPAGRARGAGTCVVGRRRSWQAKGRRMTGRATTAANRRR
ncbi:hypothetical protein LJR034_009119 [Caballeronia sp. LjRoot34]|uniref:hypothetical protein n=1 Tax=Caballeronia sp. LjRoot34 TaxID=3342325 RepID=UPI003ECFA137